jgi:hypothetical protein
MFWRTEIAEGLPAEGKKMCAAQENLAFLGAEGGDT